ncbi:MAG: hypothetical protein WDO74_28455 [Pseudomonadota bacterium]
MAHQRGQQPDRWGSVVYDRLLSAAADVEQFVTQPEFLFEHVHDAPALKRLVDDARANADARSV